MEPSKKSGWEKLPTGPLSENILNWLDNRNIGKYGGAIGAAFFKGESPETAKNLCVVTDDGGSYKVGAQYMVWWDGDNSLACWSVNHLKKSLKDIFNGKEPKRDPDYRS